jgi:mono/diheme cytochrome c family protein
MRALALLAVVAAGAAVSGCGDTTLFDMMERQPKYRAFSENPFYADGRAMRQPPAGTVPRERVLGPPELRTGRVASGGDVQQVPIKLDMAVMANGRKKFEIHCAVCHGLAGDGVSPVATQMSLRPPPSLHTLGNPAPGHIFQVISEGFGVMPSYASEINEVNDRWAIVAYVDALRRSQAARLAEAPADVQRELQK